MVALGCARPLDGERALEPDFEVLPVGGLAMGALPLATQGGMSGVRMHTIPY